VAVVILYLHKYEISY